ncbi:hypothetical protein ONA70_11945 [Micromonospora yasonensis]|uniref:hypothetical protein n=1 Tax=Micromonospora yasonensis TaxID=1128667 RepID=UPI00222E86EC|nr:hypothetical protein [Micromonospora yasonensis]MCW3840811.1 hypothetical protein [Micromonospora yasonensis]
MEIGGAHCEQPVENASLLWITRWTTAGSLWTTGGDARGAGYREVAMLAAPETYRTDDPFPLVLPVADIF